MFFFYYRIKKTVCVMSRQKFDNTTTSYLMKPHNSKAAIISDMKDS